MYQWERDALGIETLGELEGGVRVRAQVGEAVDDDTAWWISALYAPQIWRIWRVGLLRRPLRLELPEPLRSPDTMEFQLPEDVPSEVRQLAADLAGVRVNPVVVAGQALGFLVRGLATEGPPGEERTTCAVYAPTGLRSRLGLEIGQQLVRHVLPAGEYQPKARRQSSRAD